MVPSDGKFFLTNDLMHGVTAQPAEPAVPTEKAEVRESNEQ
jgi:hypothetical protein